MICTHHRQAWTCRDEDAVDNAEAGILVAPAKILSRQLAPRGSPFFHSDSSLRAEWSGAADCAEAAAASSNAIGTISPLMFLLRSLA